MSRDILDLYQEVIIDHGRRPRNFRQLEDPTRTAEGVNPSCGDEITLYVKLDDDGNIADIAFQGSGCAISQASASLMTAALKDKTQEEALALFARVNGMLTQGTTSDVERAELGKLAVLCGVWEFPMRVKCATLAWHTLRTALVTNKAQYSTQGRQ